MNLQRAWNRLRAAHEGGLPALTVARAREFLKEFPAVGAVWNTLGAALIDLARYPEAKQAIEKALSLCPPEKLWIPLTTMGHLHKARGDYNSAITWYRQAIEAVPREASGHIYLGGVLALSGRLAEAEVEHREAIECPEGCRDEAFLNLGMVLRAQERYAEAAQCFEQALELDPKYKPAKKALRDVRQLIPCPAPVEPTPMSPAKEECYEQDNATGAQTTKPA